VAEYSDPMAHIPAPGNFDLIWPAIHDDVPRFCGRPNNTNKTEMYRSCNRGSAVMAEYGNTKGYSATTEFLAVSVRRNFDVG